MHIPQLRRPLLPYALTCFAFMSSLLWCLALTVSRAAFRLACTKAWELNPVHGFPHIAASYIVALLDSVRSDDQRNG